ncbi:hypothetical protein PIB30_053153 [Stylosanthes scabra]|uniref:Uncharacterized protein n=1 Tax=Stylosanthes scabra TaxID=79078 RepID=A0ABU6RIS9_9FABA|nr:hypothetical protein [Stylosanthes scabra]
MGITHFLTIPFVIPGHIIPLIQFSNVLANHGCKVTFLNTEYNHKRMKKAVAATAQANNIDDHDKESSKMIRFVTLPDGLDPEDDRSDIGKVLGSMKKTMPCLLPKLIEDINALDSKNKISCILVTFNMSWILEVGHKLRIKCAALFPFSVAGSVSFQFIPKLIDDGIIDSDDKDFFNHIVEEMKTMELLAEWWLCNSTYDLEPGALSVSPRFLPIGPLTESDNNNKSSSFWQEDITCLEWLDQQQPQSVMYVSFGSLAVMESNQFKELALALDLIDKPFVWVVRPGNNGDKTNAFPNEFHGNKGKIVSWVPQRKILNHPSISCFVSHCGWNSTIEGIYGGVPFLCWPFFNDHFLDKSYICDVWKVGMELEKDENGFISKEEIRKKVEQLLGDEAIRERSSKLKEATRKNLGEGGQSSKNIEKFANWAK